MEALRRFLGQSGRVEGLKVRFWKRSDSVDLGIVEASVHVGVVVAVAGGFARVGVVAWLLRDDGHANSRVVGTVGAVLSWVCIFLLLRLWLRARLGHVLDCGGRDASTAEFVEEV